MITSPTIVELGAKKQFSPNVGLMPFTGSINAIFYFRFVDLRFMIVDYYPTDFAKDTIFFFVKSISCEQSEPIVSLVFCIL
jgi:hypothetical protein